MIENGMKSKCLYIWFCFVHLLVGILLLIFVLLPIHRYGVGLYLYKVSDYSSITRQWMQDYFDYEQKRLSTEWVNRLSLVDEKDLPETDWERVDCDSIPFYILDQYASDIRPLLSAPWTDSISCQKDLLYESHITDEYPWGPEVEAPPCFVYSIEDGNYHFETDSILDSSIYLPSKTKMPSRYKLEFDFCPHTVMQETFQVGFAASSLANRIRFKVCNNEILIFDIIDSGYLAFKLLNEEWKKYQKPFSFVLGEISHVKLIVWDDTFAFYVNDNLEMAVNIKDYSGEDAYWYIWFWNGYKGKGVPMSVDLSNVELFLPKKK